METSDAVSSWSREYTQQGIPSSFKQEPSGSVQYFLEYIRKAGLHSGSALDLGCGRGRNSLLLARNGFQVSAIDFVSENIGFINATAKQENLPIQAICQSVTDPLPLPEDSMDIVIDIFCYKHQTDKAKQLAYRKEVSRVLRKDGFYLLALAGDDDGFYGPLLKNSANPSIKLIVDPFTDIESLLYSREDVEREFAPHFNVIDFTHKQQPGPMHGKEYLRSTLIFIFSKKEASYA